MPATPNDTSGFVSDSHQRKLKLLYGVCQVGAICLAVSGVALLVLHVTRRVRRKQRPNWLTCIGLAWPATLLILTALLEQVSWYLD
jgi:hypothetical protein